VRLGCAAPEALDQPGAEQTDGRVPEPLRRCREIVAVPGLEPHLVWLHQPSATDFLREEVRVDQRDPLPAERVLRGEHGGVDHQAALDIHLDAGMAHELQPEIVPRLVRETDVHDLVGFDEAREVRIAMRRGDARVADEGHGFRPQEVAHQIGHGGPRVHHRDVDVTERRTHSVRTHDIDIHLGTDAVEVAQDRHSELHREARRHLHAQGALSR